MNEWKVEIMKREKLNKFQDKHYNPLQTIDTIAFSVNEPHSSLSFLIIIFFFVSNDGMMMEMVVTNNGGDV